METGQVSSWVSFLRVIKGKEYTKNTITRKFKSLVDKVDYEKGDVKNLIEYASKYGSTKPLAK
jgi:hypothetical protein